MDRRASRIIRIFIFSAVGIGLLPIIPASEVRAPVTPQEPLVSQPARSTASIVGASTIEKLRLLFAE